MTLKEFDKLNIGGYMYIVVDANKTGYMTNPNILLIAGRDVAKRDYGDKEVIGVASTHKNKLTVYVK
jgi:hypothetical protein